MKTIWNNFKVAFAMYSKIPMPPADWEKREHEICVVFLSVGRTGCRCSFGGAFLAAAADWRGKHAAGCSADGSSGSGDGRHSPRRLSGYDGCVKFLERKTAPTGNLKRPARRSICDYYGMSVFCTVRGRSRRTCLEDFFRRMHLASQFRDRSAVFRSRFFQMPIRKEQRQRLA